MNDLSLEKIMADDGFWWVGDEPFSIKPDAGGTFQGWVDENFHGVMIDCRIPVEVREQMATGKRPVLSYGVWKEQDA